jgi:aminoglycoside 6'-N-acetyltransferase I
MLVVDNVQVRLAQASDLEQLARLCEALWPYSSTEDHVQELRLTLGGKADLVLTMPLAIFLAEGSDGMLVGLLEVDLRSHADGCDPSQPLGYIEGW